VAADVLVVDYVVVDEVAPPKVFGMVVDFVEAPLVVLHVGSVVGDVFMQRLNDPEIKSLIAPLIAAATKLQL